METTLESPSVAPDIAAPSERVIVLAGRTFRQSTVTTIDRDAYVIKRYRASRLAAFAKTFNPATDDLDEFSERLLLEAYESGVLYEILAGVLVEDGVRWTRKVAEANAAFFANLEAPGDKLVIAECSGDVLFDFLVLAARSRQTFPNILGTTERSGHTPALDEPPHDEPADDSRPPATDRE